jgi:rSAM/selenodomain-associated transferase 1
MVARLVLLFTKPARPGKVKTRLVGPLSAVEAARLHEAFLGDILERLQGGSFDLQVAWAVSPAEDLPSGPPPALRQVGSDLGERLFEGLSAAAGRATCVAAIGSDHPSLSRDHLERAFDLLETRRADVVLGPAHDGGYYLIAARREVVCEHLFRDIPWSTSAVLSETIARCADLDVRVQLLEELTDVDRPADLKLLMRKLESGDLECPRTARFLRAWEASRQEVAPE